jgi:hypothetical protein
MKPCDKCIYEWHDPKNNCSCRDQCEEYKAYLAGNKSDLADTLLYGPRIEASPK